MELRISLSLFAFALIVPASGFAEEGDVHARATDRFVLGRTAQERGDCKLALELFTASLAIEPSRGALLNMAICEEKLGLLGTAMSHFKELLPELPPKDDRFPVVTDHIAKLGPRVPRLKIDLAKSAARDAKVTLDEHPLAAAALGTEIASDPGKHTIDVSARGTATKHYDIVLAEGNFAPLTVETGAALPAEKSATPEQAPTSGNRTLGFVLGGVGIAGLAAGGAMGIVSLVDHGKIASACPTQHDCSQSTVDQASTGKTLSIASTVALAAGVVGVGLGAYFVLSSSSENASANQPKVGFTFGSSGGRADIVVNF